MDLQIDSQSEISNLQSDNPPGIANSEMTESNAAVSEMDFFEESPINREENIDAYSKLTVSKINDPEIKEIKTVEKENAPKTIIVKKIQNVENFSATVEKDCDPNFTVKIANEELKFFPNE